MLRRPVEPATQGGHIDQSFLNAGERWDRGESEPYKREIVSSVKRAPHDNRIRPATRGFARVDDSAYRRLLERLQLSHRVPRWKTSHKMYSAGCCLPPRGTRLIAV